MIHRIVQFALRQRFLVLLMVAFIAVGGAISFQHMPVDAYPDLSPPMVEIITQWPGHAAEEIERLVTVPTEVEMNGVPKMSVMRSISLYGLSDVILTFDEDTDDYFAREVVFQRLSEVTYPTGVTPTLAPLASPSGLVYRYVIQSPDRTPQELKVYEDWVIEREYKQVPGVADDSGFGGTVMQYQVLLDPARLYAYHITVPTVMQQLSVNNSNAGGGFYSQGGQFYYVRGLGLIRDTQDIGDVIVGTQNGVPVRIRDIGEVTIGNAPRLGEFGFNKTDDAVEGVIMMRRGEQTQNVLKGVEAKTQQLNEHILPARRESAPLLRPQRSGAADHRHGRAQHGAGDGPGAHRADGFSGEHSRRGDRRAHHSAGPAVFVYFSACAGSRRQPAFDWRHRFWNSHRRNPGDGGEHFPRAGRARRPDYDLHEVILAAAKDVDRPIFYSVAVIIAGYLPIYALGGPSGKLFKPMADTVSIALVGALILTLTFVPVMCAYWFKKGVHERVNKPFEWVRDKYAGELDWCLDHPEDNHARWPR